MNHRRCRYAVESEIRLKRSDQKVWSRAKAHWLTDANGYSAPGIKVAPKAVIIMYQAELGKPYMLLAKARYQTARGRNGIEGRRTG